MTEEMTGNLILPLYGLNCGKCVAKAKQALDDNNLPYLSLEKNQIELESDTDLKQIFIILETLGYQLAEKYQLELSGLGCGKCVTKLTTALEKQPLIFKNQITTTSAEINTSLSISTLFQLIQDVGYQARERNTQQEHLAANSIEVDATKDVFNDTNQKQSIQNQSEKIQLILSGMTCASCVASVEKAVLSVKGVENVSVNLAERSALINANALANDIIQAIENAGYGAELIEDPTTRREKSAKLHAKEIATHKINSILSLALGIPMMAWGLLGGNMMIDSKQSQMAWGIIGVITFFTLAYCGKHFFVNAYKAAKHGRATMDSLIALGTGAAWVYSFALVLFPDFFPAQARHVYFEASVMILGLVSLGHAIESKARGGASKALDRLLDLQPPKALIIENGIEKSIDLSQVSTGMIIRIKPGAKIPVDGVVIEGQSYVDESMLTGEPIAVLKNKNSQVKAGTVNQKGSFDFIAQSIGQDTLLSRIISLVNQAQSSKPEVARLADKISSVFVPLVILIAIMSASVWYMFGPEPKLSYMLVSAMTVLLIACPCALGLATPMSVIASVGRAAELGVLVKDANALQQAASIDTIVFDKTGTLTQGKPQVTQVVAIDNSENDLLTIAASLEQHSEHPLAFAILTKAQDISLMPISDFQSITGQGISAVIENNTYFLGNKSLMLDNQIDILMAEESFQQMSNQGMTTIFVACKNQSNTTSLLGMIGISDPLREDTASSIEKLKNYRVIMLTGDNEKTAKAIAKQAGISEVIAEVFPDQKDAVIQNLQKQGAKVAMVGDGINDAPALARADVGIAMSSGSDVAIESAQMTLMRHSISAVFDSLALSKATFRNIKQNLFGAFIYNCLGIPIAAGALYPITGDLLSPIVAGAAMALSSITVVTNANRLRFFKP